MFTMKWRATGGRSSGLCPVLLPYLTANLYVITQWDSHDRRWKSRRCRSVQSSRLVESVVFISAEIFVYILCDWNGHMYQIDVTQQSSSEYFSHSTRFQYSGLVHGSVLPNTWSASPLREWHP
jgi:hypothetical protein